MALNNKFGSKSPAYKALHPRYRKRGNVDWPNEPDPDGFASDIGYSRFTAGVPYQSPNGLFCVPIPVLLQIEDEMYSSKRFKWRFLKEIGIYLFLAGFCTGPIMLGIWLMLG